MFILETSSCVTPFNSHLRLFTTLQMDSHHPLARRAAMSNVSDAQSGRENAAPDSTCSKCRQLLSGCAESSSLFLLMAQNVFSERHVVVMLVSAWFGTPSC